MLKKFCCLELRTAGVVIGFLSVAGSIFLFTGSVITLCLRHEIANSLTEIFPDYSNQQIAKSTTH